MDGRPIAEQIDAMAIDALTEVGIEMEDDLRQSLDTAYPPASAPGEAPHRRTGNLQNSVYSKVEEFVDAGPELYIGVNKSNAPYADYLEHGTERGLAPRPFIGPLKERWRGERFADAIQRAMDSYTRAMQRW